MPAVFAVLAVFVVFALASGLGQQAQASTRCLEADENNVASTNQQANASAADIHVLANDFPALHAVTQAMQDCAPKGLRIIAEHSSEYRQLQVPALQKSPPAFNVVMTGNNAIVPLLNKNLLMPLDDLLEEFAPHIPAQQRVRFDNQTMAVALLANAQHLFVREDLLSDAKLATPASLDQLLHACEVLKSQGMKYPYAAAYKVGWDLGLEFINWYLAYGGNMESENRQVKIDRSAASSAITAMKGLSRCMSPDFLSNGINEVQAAWQAGNHAMMTLWGSRATAILDEPTTLPVVKANTHLYPALLTTEFENQSASPAATLWWVGFALPARASKAAAETAFKLLSQRALPEILRSHPGKAVWLMQGYKPDRNASGVKAVVDAGAPAYPGSALTGMLHEAAGLELVDYLQQQQGLDAALDDLQAAFTSKAAAAGLVDID